MIHGAGVDVGSTQTKAVIVDEGRRIVARALIATGANVSRAGENAFAAACEAAALPREAVGYVVGYDRTDAIRTISTRHEQTAGHMADAYFRVAHRPVATLTSCGPGSANIPVALACAFMDSSALLAITANIPTSQFNRAAFQETYRHFQADFPSVIRPYVKRSWQPTRTDMLPIALRQAFATMLGGRPGPVNLDVPFNVFKEPAEVDVPEPGAWRAGIEPRSGGDPDAIRRAVELLRAARRPLIYVGHGVTLSEAADELTALARRLRIPVIFSPNGFGALDMTDPLALGFVGRNGVFQANEAARTCDVLLALGVRFDDRSSSSWIPGYSFYIPPTRLIHVDIDAGEIGRNYPVHLGVVGDARTVLRQLLALSETADSEVAGHDAWLTDIATWRARWRGVRAAARDERGRAHTSGPGGPGAPEGDPRRRDRPPRRRRAPPLRHPVLEGTAALDAALHLELRGHRLRRLRRARRQAGRAGPPVRRSMRRRRLHDASGRALYIRRVRHPRGLGHLEQLCVRRHPRHPDRDARQARDRDQLRPREGRPAREPDFVALARACGADGIRVERPGDLAGALEPAVKADAPFVLDVHVDRDIRPPGVGTSELPPLPYGSPRSASAG